MAAVSAAAVCANAGGTPAATVVGTARCAVRTSRRDVPTGRRAEREREGSGAKSTQRKTARQADRCRVTTARQLAPSTPRARLFGSENSQCRIARRHVPKFYPSQKAARAGFCSIAPATIVPFALQAWSEMGTRLAPWRFPQRRRRMRNDSRQRSMSRSRSLRRRIVCSFSSSMSFLEYADLSGL